MTSLARFAALGCLPESPARGKGKWSNSDSPMMLENKGPHDDFLASMVITVLNFLNRGVMMS